MMQVRPMSGSHGIAGSSRCGSPRGLSERGTVPRKRGSEGPAPCKVAHMEVTEKTGRYRPGHRCLKNMAPGLHESMR
jgi:hypothetical protein